MRRPHLSEGGVIGDAKLVSLPGPLYDVSVIRGQEEVEEKLP